MRKLSAPDRSAIFQYRGGDADEIPPGTRLPDKIGDRSLLRLDNWPDEVRFSRKSCTEGNGCVSHLLTGEIVEDG